MTDLTPPRMTAADRMAKARAVRDANKAKREAEKLAHVESPPLQPEIQRQAKKAPIFEDVAAARTQTLEEPRGPRSQPGRIEVTGRNGEVLSRSRQSVGDSFEIPKKHWPVGWSYQWNAISIIGNTDVIQNQIDEMVMNGWRPVPAERHAGTLLPTNAKGNIIRGQMMLVERPEELTKEARDEDLRNAYQLINDRNESLKLAGVKKELGPGFEMSNRYRDTGGGVRIQIDKSMDVVNLNRNSGGYKVEE